MAPSLTSAGNDSNSTIRLPSVNPYSAELSIVPEGRNPGMLSANAQAADRPPARPRWAPYGGLGTAQPLMWRAWLSGPRPVRALRSHYSNRRLPWSMNKSHRDPSSARNYWHWRHRRRLRLLTTRCPSRLHRSDLAGLFENGGPSSMKPTGAGLAAASGGSHVEQLRTVASSMAISLVRGAGDDETSTCALALALVRRQSNRHNGPREGLTNPAAIGAPLRCDFASGCW